MDCRIFGIYGIFLVEFDVQVGYVDGGKDYDDQENQYVDGVVEIEL